MTLLFLNKHNLLEKCFSYDYVYVAGKISIVEDYFSFFVFVFVTGHACISQEQNKENKQEQAQRGAAGDRSGRKYSKISITKSVNFGPLGPLCPFLKSPPELIKNGSFQK